MKEISPNQNKEMKRRTKQTIIDIAFIVVASASIGMAAYILWAFLKDN